MKADLVKSRGELSMKLKLKERRQVKQEVPPAPQQQGGGRLGVRRGPLVVVTPGHEREPGGGGTGTRHRRTRRGIEMCQM
ncbi:hypothetical protein CEXT_711591 [Caerostris extrusa]|uniref:Uncharacterized protein n=1 Tax=Caerostris extrusa TaxID=172846 RepID=A0AAV4N4C1_CAEEX|nr:hypothetical protein CEXT_711591 [Caerostris extrusa]